MKPWYHEAIGNAVRATAGRVAGRLSAFAHGVPGVPGMGSPFANYRLPRDERQQQMMASREALAGRTTYGAGPVPSYISTYAGGLTAQRIRAIHTEVRTTGYMTNKASLDEEFLLADAHLYSVDSSFRDSITGRPFTVDPCDDSELALQVADYQLAVIDQIDSYQESCRRLLFGNAGGYAIEEAIFDESPTPLDCLLGGQKVTVWGHHPRQRQWVSNQHTRWDVQTDELLLDMGLGKFVAPPVHKFPLFEASGDFQTRRRGYMYPNSWLHLIKTNAVARWAVVLELWGIPVPWGKVAWELWQDSTRREAYEKIISQAGQGRGFVATDDLEIGKAFETTSGDARGMHAALIAWATSEQSKLVQGEILTTETGGPSGSHALSETHADTKEARVANTARQLSNTERRWQREALKFAIYDVLPDGSFGMPSSRGLCAVLNATPQQILGKVGIPHWRVQREMTPSARMDLFDKGVNQLGLKIDESQPYQEFGFKRPRRTTDKILRGKAQVVGAEERVTPSLQNAAEQNQQPDKAAA